LIHAAQLRIRRLPEGHVVADDFEQVTVALPALAPEQVRVRNEWMSLDPYMRIMLRSG
jgi:NADPH-dependent curcumin reductase CurA